MRGPAIWAARALDPGFVAFPLGRWVESGRKRRSREG